MSTRKLKRKQCLNHRQAEWEKALDGLIAGKVSPEYVTERWDKLKQVKGK